MVTIGLFGIPVQTHQLGAQVFQHWVMDGKGPRRGHPAQQETLLPAASESEKCPERGEWDARQAPHHSDGYQHRWMAGKGVHPLHGSGAISAVIARGFGAWKGIRVGADVPKDLACQAVQHPGVPAGGSQPAKEMADTVHQGFLLLAV